MAFSQPSKTPDLAQRTQDLITRTLEPVNAQSPFLDPETTIRNLSMGAFPQDKAEQERYAEKIKLSLQAHLKDGNINTLWAELKNKYCTTAGILTGLLHFFAGKINENEIDISGLLNKPQMPGKSYTAETVSIDKNQVRENAKSNLMAFVKELQQSNPNIPQYPPQTPNSPSQIA